RDEGVRAARAPRRRSRRALRQLGRPRGPQAPPERVLLPHADPRLLRPPRDVVAQPPAARAPVRARMDPAPSVLERARAPLDRPDRREQRERPGPGPTGLGPGERRRDAPGPDGPKPVRIARPL